LGEYIHRIYDETRKRPLFIVRNKYGTFENSPNEIPNNLFYTK